MRAEDRRSFIKKIAVNSGCLVFVLSNNQLLQAASFVKLFDEANAVTGHENELADFGIYIVGDNKIQATFSISKEGITMIQIQNKTTNFAHLHDPVSLFEIEINKTSGYRNNHNIQIDKISAKKERGLKVYGHVVGQPLSFLLSIATSNDKGVLLMQCRLANNGSAPLSLQAAIPKLNGIVTKGKKRPMAAAIPQEIGSVISLEEGAPPIGMLPNKEIGLPTAMNTMEVVSIYDRDNNGGIFFADVTGNLEDTPPVQFVFSENTVSGYWKTDLQPAEERNTPAIAIGVHDEGDWHNSIDYYVSKHKKAWQFPKIPEWFRDAGAIYGFSGGGAGAIYMHFPSRQLPERINSFLKLPELLEEAQRLGTNVVYLWDYWEGASEGTRPPYWNKGDYIPRKDLGGQQAFKEGIKQLHEQGGKIILYVEPFIVYQYSKIGKEKGEQWAARNADGQLYRQYNQNYTMVPFLPEWQEYITGVCERLVKEFDADGIFLDSWAWQMNWPVRAGENNKLYSSQQYSRGVLQITDKVLKAIQAIKSDAVVIGETTSGPVWQHWHGGLSADFAWNAKQNNNRIVASPVRYGIPEINFITNGTNLNQLYQVFAAGHSLALCNTHLPQAAEIRPLVKTRQKYKDALIYGKQLYQPETGNEDVAAYYYRGLKTELIIVVNISPRPFNEPIILKASEAGTAWKNVLNDQVLTASGRNLLLAIPPYGLSVLQRSSF